MRPFKNKRVNEFRVGVHTSIAGGISKAVERAVSLNATTLQIFSHNPRQWRKTPIEREEAERFVILRQKYDIKPVFIHASYLINLASISDSILNKSIELLSYELAGADTLGVEYVVLHTGSAKGENGKTARNRAVKAIIKAVGKKQYKASLLLENTAGKRGDITSSIQTLAEIIDTCQSDRVAGICIDTCHAFSSGYDLTLYEGIEKLFSEIKEYIGIDKLKLIHLNDSKRPLGSGIDRHEHIGKGFIGTRGFNNMLSDKRITRVPLILETPKKTEDDDKNNLRKVFDILSKNVY
jgi:deoxyribonuclease-4